MTAAIAAWWKGLSAREQLLVGIAGTLFAGIVGWFLIYIPLTTALRDAQAAHGAALDRQGAIVRRADALRTEGRARSTDRLSSAPVAAIVTQYAAEAGLPLSRNDPAGEDGAAIAISSGRSAAILGLILSLEQQGVRPVDLAIRPTGDGNVSLVATMRRAGN